MTREELLKIIEELEDIVFNEADWVLANAAMYELKRYKKLFEEQYG